MAERHSAGEVCELRSRARSECDHQINDQHGDEDGRGEADERADFVIYKDIDVETQLDAALVAMAENKSRGQANGK